MLYQPAWLPLCTIAQVTSKIILGPSAVNPFTSHPINIAGNIALLDEISKGRTYLGICRGAWLDYIGFSYPKPIAALKEAFICVQHLLEQNKDPLKAKYFSIQGGDSLRWPIFRKNIPMLLCTWGFKTLEKCYPYISEIKLGGTTNPDLVAHFASKIRDISQTNGNSHLVDVVIGAVCVIDNDGVKAKELAKKKIALYLPVIAELDPILQINENTLENIKAAAREFDYDKAGEYINDDILKKFTCSGLQKI